MSSRYESEAAGAAARHTPVTAAALPDGTLLEMTYSKEMVRSSLVRLSGGAIETLSEHRHADGRRLTPLSPTNNLLTHRVVLLPTEAAEYGTKKELLARVRDHIHHYCDLSAVFEQIAVHYVLLTWLHDRFSELPYLRVQGEPGSGKTRFLLVVGSLCNKPIFASGASTVSPLFRMLDSIRGTLVLDEADFRFSDEKSEVVKILNNGISQGFPVLRSEQDGRTKEFNPRAYHVFGPKLIATRGPFEDRALETRFLAEHVGSSRLRSDVPISLPASQAQEAQDLRDQLLLFRLREHAKAGIDAARVPKSLSPRLQQMLGPLLSLVDDSDVRGAIVAHAEARMRTLTGESGLPSRDKVIEEVIRLWNDPRTPPTLGRIAAEISRMHDAPVTPRSIGSFLRHRLGLRIERGREGYALLMSERSKLLELAATLAVDPGG